MVQKYIRLPSDLPRGASAKQMRKHGMEEKVIRRVLAQREYAKSHQRKLNPKQKEARNAARREYYDLKANWCHTTMGGACQKCGYKHSRSAMDYHHLDPRTKRFGIAEGLAGGLSSEEIGNELRNCILLCKNCHAAFHAGDLELPKEFLRFDPTRAFITGWHGRSWEEAKGKGKFKKTRDCKDTV